jgi:hypothetical protein
MRVHLVLIALIGVILLWGGCNATLIPDQSSTISSSTDWVVVAHQSTITVVANNATGGTVPNATVTMALNSTTLGSLSPSSGTTDASGKMTGTFLAGTKSGAVNITATIRYIDGGTTYTVTKVYTQEIDHDVANNAAFDFQSEVTVGSETPFNISFTDKYANPIDNRNPNDPHLIHLTISASSDNMAAFNISGSHVQDATSLPLDSGGNISVNAITDTKPGENEILLKPFGNVGYPWGIPQFIYGINNAVPYSMVQSITPASLTEPADNLPEHIFSVTDTLFDKYGNPTRGQIVSVQSNWAGDTAGSMTTDSWGNVTFTYGPHSSSGYVTLTSTAVSNTSVSMSQTVQFYNTAPVNMIFSATPQVMPSRDVKPGQTAQLVGKVMDLMGNPVPNQTVYFSMGTPTYTYQNCSIGGPSLLNTSAVTDANGKAVAIFIPGKFDTNKGNVSYDATATGYVTMTATWNTVQVPIQLSWKNYPYLSEQTSISNQNVNVGDTFSVTINLTADGWNLTGTPADVVIVSDLAAGIGGSTRLGYTKTSEVGFIKNATDNTYISLASFGDSPNPGVTPYASTNTTSLWNQQKAAYPTKVKLFNPYGNVWDNSMVAPANYDAVHSSDNFCFNNQPCTNATNPMGYYYLNPWSDAKIDTDLMNAGPTFGHQNALITTVNGYTAYGGTDYAAGINAALEELKSKGNPSHNQTIIIMGDGVNMMAPISPGSKESYWPSDWNPRNGTGTSEGPNLWWLDESDIGKAASIDSATRAKNQGITIYGIQFPTPDNSGHYLNDTAFFQSLVSSPSTWYYAPDPTTMSGIFQLIEGQIQNTAGVNTTMALNLQSVAVTYNNATNMTPGDEVFAYVYDPTASTLVTDQNGNTYVINQTDEWNNNQTLIFNVGKMTVGQTWSTTFELRILKPGSMNIPGNQSSISFNTGESLGMNQQPFNGVLDYSNTGFNNCVISVSDLHVQNTTITNIVPLQWNITYPGNGVATETLYYNSKTNPTWKSVDSPHSVSPGNWTETYEWNVGSLPPGTYYVRVQTNAPYCSWGQEIIPGGIDLGQSSKAFIKLE